jgi:hypothetical protein
MRSDDAFRSLLTSLAPESRIKAHILAMCGIAFWSFAMARSLAGSQCEKSGWGRRSGLFMASWLNYSTLSPWIS